MLIVISNNLEWFKKKPTMLCYNKVMKSMNIYQVEHHIGIAILKNPQKEI